MATHEEPLGESLIYVVGQGDYMRSMPMNPQLIALRMEELLRRISNRKQVQGIWSNTNNFSKKTAKMVIMETGGKGL